MKSITLKLETDAPYIGSPISNFSRLNGPFVFYQDRDNNGKLETYVITESTEYKVVKQPNGSIVYKPTYSK